MKWTRLNRPILVFALVALVTLGAGCAQIGKISDATGNSFERAEDLGLISTEPASVATAAAPATLPALPPTLLGLAATPDGGKYYKVDSAYRNAFTEYWMARSDVLSLVSG